MAVQQRPFDCSKIMPPQVFQDDDDISGPVPAGGLLVHLFAKIGFCVAKSLVFAEFRFFRRHKVVDTARIPRVDSVGAGVLLITY